MDIAEDKSADLGQIKAFDVVKALADRTRWAIVKELWETSEKACGTFNVDVSPSTLTHHFAVLRNAGVIEQRAQANRKMTTLRLDELEVRFPGLLRTLMEDPAPASKSIDA